MIKMPSNRDAAIEPQNERQRHTSQEWEDQRPFIMTLFGQYNYKDVIRILWEERHFKVR